MLTRIRLLTLPCALLIAAPSLAQNTLSLGTITARPGDTEVAVPLRAMTAASLTGLSVDIEFDRTLCDRIENQTLARAGRATEGEVTGGLPQEGGIRCPEEGRVSIVFFDLEGDVLVPSGDGPIAEWRFSVRDDAPPGEFPLALRVRQIRDGTFDVAVTATDGRLTIEGAPPPCTGDCDGGGSVDISELIRGVNIALGNAAITTCQPFDCQNNGMVPIPCLIQGVNNANNGCPPAVAAR